MSALSEKTILVTGGRGFIGGAVAAALGQAGFAARVGVRKLSAPDQIACDLDQGGELGAAVAGA